MEKKQSKWIWTALVCLTLTSGVGRTASANTVVSAITPTTLAQSHATPEILADFLKQSITFEEDIVLFNQIDYWQKPEELLSRRQGDCEDYALLAQAVLERQGLEAFPFSLYGAEDYAHTVCVFVEDGKYNVINQDQVIRYEADSLESLAGHLNPDWNWGAIAERAGHRGRAVQVIQNAA